MRRGAIVFIVLVVIMNIKAFAQQSIYGSTIIETAAFDVGVIRIILKEDCTIVTKMVMPKTAPFWICCDKSQYIEDIATGKKYYIKESDIGFKVEKYILETKDDFTYQEIYPPLPKETRRINISSGNKYYITEFELDWNIYNLAVFKEKYYNPLINGLNSYKYQSTVDAANAAIAFCKKNFKHDYQLENICAINTILGLMYFNFADYHNAIKYYERALSYSYKLSNNIKSQTKMYNATSIAPILHNLSSCYFTIGNYSDAIKYASECVNYFNAFYGEKSTQYVGELMNISLYYYGIGNIDKSLQTAELALNIMHVLMNEDDPMESIMLSSIDLMGNTEGAKDKLDAYRINRLFIYACLLDNLSALYRYVGEKSKSKEYSNNALVLKKRLIDKGESFYASFLNSYINNISLSSFNDQEVLKVYNDAYKYYKTMFGDLHPRTAQIASNLAILHLSNKDYASAIKYNTQALCTHNTIYGDNHSAYLRSLFMRIFINNYFEKVHTLNVDISNYVQKTISFIVKQFKTLSSVERSNLWTSHNLGFIIPILPKNNNEDINKTIFQLLLFTKGLILSTDIEFDRVILESGNKELLFKFEELRTIRAIINKCNNKPIAERPQEEVEKLERKAEALEKVLIKESKEYADFTRYLSIEWQDVRDALNKDDLAIELLAAENINNSKTSPYYAALLLRKGWKSPKFVELLSANEVEELKSLYKKTYSAYSIGNSQKLYGYIWSKLEPYINEGDNVYFSPDGLLHQINIEVLQDANGRRANEKWNLHRVSSTRELCMEKSEIKKTSAVMYGSLAYDMDNASLIAQSRATMQANDKSVSRGFIADSTLRAGWKSLPATKAEVNAISNMLESHKIGVKTYTGVVGNEESFKSLSGKKTPIIHLATHGFFYKNDDVNKKPFLEQICMESQNYFKPDNSLKRSGLILAGAQRAWAGEQIPSNVEDGILLAEEIAAMDLRGTDLVVLSACETGLGEITSEGVFGLQRAFKKAGVQTLIMSLWKVDDNATSLFMQTFYKHWLDGKSKHEAFSIAQSTVRDNESYSNPYYWAAFIMLD